MKIALASTLVKDRDVAYNTSVMIRTIEACKGKADMVVFGESVLQGFNCLDWVYSTDKKIAVLANGPEISAIAEAAKCYSVAVSFGYIEKDGESLYSSQIVLDERGELLHNYRRISAGWKNYWLTDNHYKEGSCFSSFVYSGKRFAIGLCGDLWIDGKPEEMKSLGADIVLWPVYCDFDPDEWNGTVKFEYAQQASLCGETVLYVNPVCNDASAADRATGGAALLQGGSITAEFPAGLPGLLFVEL